MPSPFRLAILCFHRVLPASRRAGPDAPYFQRQTALELERFRALLDELERRSAIASPEALVAWADPSTRARVILTFDDGYADVLEFALPELKKRGVTALLCATTAVASGAQEGFPVDHWYAALQGARTGRGTLQGIADAPWSFDLSRAEDRSRLIDGPEKRAFVRASPEEQGRILELLRGALGVDPPPAIPALLDLASLATLQREGWLLGSHGERHALLPSLSDEEVLGELTRSRAFFPEHGLPAPSIVAYPDGATSPRVEALARAAGYSLGLGLGSRFVTTEDRPLHLPRLIPTNEEGWFERRLLPLFTPEEC